MENLKALQASQSDKQMQEYRSGQDRQGFASLRAGMMFGCYRKQDANGGGDRDPLGISGFGD